MASTYSPNLRIELIGNGEQSNTWGTTTNTNLGTLIEQAISGLVSVDVTAGNVTLTSLNGASDQSRQMIIVATGTPGVTRTITAPAVNKVYIVYNNSNATLSFIASGGTGVSLSIGAKKLVYCDGTNFVEAINAVAITSGSIDGVAIGATTASTGAFTTLSASSTISGTGFSTYLASPPAIGTTAPAAGKFTNLEYTGTLTGSTGILNIGSGQVYKDASGNVGIGTSSPAAKLDIGTGNLNFSGTAQRITGDFTTGLDTGLGFQSNVTNSITFIPVFPNGTGIQSNLALFNGSDITNYSRFNIRHNTSSSTLTNQVVGTGAYVPFSIETGGFERLRIDTSGNVGIGTSSPSQKLHVAGNIFAASGVNLGASGGEGGEISFQSISGTGAGMIDVDVGNNWRFFNALATSTIFYTNSTERMRIDSSGNVGIGGANYGNKLALHGGIRFLANEAAATTYTGIGSIVSDNVSISTVGTERMRINSSGIVTMYAYGAGAATFSATGVISSVSDETWKIKDGVPVDADSMLKNLEPGYWYYNNEKKEIFGTDRQLGFYAQNVNAAIGPEAAPTPEEGKPWGYYDRSVLAVAVMSLQKALTTIESLTERLTALENK